MVKAWDNELDMEKTKALIQLVHVTSCLLLPVLVEFGRVQLPVLLPRWKLSCGCMLSVLISSAFCSVAVSAAAGSILEQQYCEIEQGCERKWSKRGAFPLLRRSDKPVSSSAWDYVSGHGKQLCILLHSVHVLYDFQCILKY